MKTSKTTKKRTVRDPEKTLSMINKSMRDGIRLEADGLWFMNGGDPISLLMPQDLKEMVWATLAGTGDTPVSVAKRLTCYGRSEWERRFVNVFPDDEPDAAHLTERTDHRWVVIAPPYPR